MTHRRTLPLLLLAAGLFLRSVAPATADPSEIAGHRATLSLVPVGSHSVRITLRPVGDTPSTVPISDGRVLAPREWPDPAAQITDLNRPRSLQLDYKDGEATWTRLSWNEDARILTIDPGKSASGARAESRQFEVVLVEGWDNPQRTMTYTGEPMTVTFKPSD